MADKIRKTYKHACKKWQKKEEAEKKSQEKKAAAEARELKRSKFLQYDQVLVKIKEAAKEGDEDNMCQIFVGATCDDSFQHALKIIRKLKRDKFRVASHVMLGGVMITVN